MCFGILWTRNCGVWELCFGIFGLVSWVWNLWFGFLWTRNCGVWKLCFGIFGLGIFGLDSFGLAIAEFGVDADDAADADADAAAMQC